MPVSANQGGKLKAFEYSYPKNFLKSIEENISASLTSGKPGGVMLVQIRNLPVILEACGHQKTEEIIRGIHQETCNLIKGFDTSCVRIQRDLFGISLKQASMEAVEGIAMQINQLASDYGQTSGHAVHVLTNIGSVSFPISTQNAQDAIDKSYIAMNHRAGISYTPYEKILDNQSESVKQMALASYLNHALKESRLRLAYQPVINAKSGSIDSYECLLRTVDEHGTLNSAGALIPIAEKMGLINVIDYRVLDMVVEELLLAENVRFAFNVSNLTTDDARWLARVGEIFKEHPEIANRITVEITETAAQRDLRETAYFIAALQEMGCMVALDDFGSGYTSFRQLKALSIDIVKIDGSFIKDLLTNSYNRFFVKTLLDFTSGMGIQSVAEFVENGETAKALMEMGIDYLQGYFLGKPLNHRAWLSDGEYGA